MVVASETVAVVLRRKRPQVPVNIHGLAGQHRVRYGPDHAVLLFHRDTLQRAGISIDAFKASGARHAQQCAVRLADQQQGHPAIVVGQEVARIAEIAGKAQQQREVAKQGALLLREPLRARIGLEGVAEHLRRHGCGAAVDVLTNASDQCPASCLLHLAPRYFICWRTALMSFSPYGGRSPAISAMGILVCENTDLAWLKVLKPSSP